MGCDSTFEGSPGNKIVPTLPDFAVPFAAVVPVPLAFTAAGIRRVTIQNTHLVAGAGLLRVRPVGGAVGSGAILDSLQSVSFGGGDGAITPLEIEGIGPGAGSFTVIAEGSGP